MKRARKDDEISMEEDAGMRAREHGGLPAVHLRPAVLLAGNSVRRVQISPSPRTPSPYGSRMGDHTVAWAVHLDVIKAELYGMPIEDAVVWLQKTHNEATRWMADATSTQMKMLEWLSDYEARVLRLEDSDFRTRTHIDEALKGMVAGRADEMTAALGPALAHHLAYVNYTPYATVRNLKDRSTGSAEAHYRKIIMQCERYYVTQAAKREEMETEQAPTQPVQPGKATLTRTGTVILQPEPPAPAPPDPATVKAALWRMFSFDAALRETGLNYALSQDAALQPRKDSRTLGMLAVQLMKHLNQRKSFVLDQAGIEQQAKAISERLRGAGSQQHLFKAAQTIKNVAANMVFAEADTIEYYKNQINKYLALSKAETQSETTKANDSAERFVKITSHLLHEHQRLCSIAYPMSVAGSGFLAPSPAEAAMEQLTAQIAVLYPKLKPKLSMEAGVKLLAALKAELDKMPKLPAVDQPKGWVTDDTCDPLVVTFTAGKGADVNGRPPAPAGVAGMGCHTTAWVIQSTAVKKLLRGKATDEDGLDGLEAAVESDLASDLVKLDRYLPLAQLEGGQLKAMFQAAFDTLTDATTGESAASYLTFRNLLPFATVDAGDRGGHGESLEAGMEQTFDAKALGTTLELLTEERRRARRQIAARLRTVADELEEELTCEGTDRWRADYRITAAVEDSVDRLREEADLLTAQPAGDVTPLIKKVREAEHRRLYLEAHKA
ncbi:hypothetical protein HS041_26885 [Planomonospora sp. ID67723]|uniref:hypothetical protein n=1 Tax=Planomonospora sp. ID67723 TaxID=2738134 RepID=UPI0018C3B847|nr:hypothetical protein [Planomonospora sp. ID67723]MBG0831376.1 hypothetical protein [Planomonospora sp. ID67723]